MPLPENWPGADLPTSVHGTAIAFRDLGVLIVGPAGSGKSSMAFQLMALGAGLISDDLSWLHLRGAALYIARPEHVSAPLRIEARSMGLLPAAAAPAAPLHLLVDMSETESRRLPEPHHQIIAKQPIRTFRRVDNPAFPAMVLQYLKSEQG